MFRNLSPLLFTMIITACSTSSDRLLLQWEVIQKLPTNDSHPHLGLAGPVTGVMGDKLLIAGGANFPEAMPWDGGKKAYQHRAYLYQIGENDLTLYKDFFFGDSIAYAGNVSVNGFLYSAGGEDEQGAVSAVWRYSLDVDDRLIKQRLPSLPLRLTNGGMVCVDNMLYFVGGENAEKVSDKVYKLDLDKGATQWEEFLSLPYPLTHAVIVSDTNRKIFIVGGRKRNEGGRSDIYDAVLELDTDKKEIVQRNVLPQPLAAGTGICLDGRLIVIGGDDASTFHRVEDMIGEIGRMEARTKKDSLIAEKNTLQRNHPGFSKAVWELDLKTNTWNQLDDLVGQSPVTTTAVLYGDTIIVPSGEVKAGVRTDQILWGKIGEQL